MKTNKNHAIRSLISSVHDKFGRIVSVPSAPLVMFYCMRIIVKERKRERKVQMCFIFTVVFFVLSVFLKVTFWFGH